MQICNSCAIRGVNDLILVIIKAVYCQPRYSNRKTANQGFI